MRLTAGSVQDLLTTVGGGCTENRLSASEALAQVGVKMSQKLLLGEQPCAPPPDASVGRAPERRAAGERKGFGSL